MSGYVLRPFRPEDAPTLHRLHTRHARADRVDALSTIEPVPDVDTMRHRMLTADWAAVAVDGGSPVGWGSLRSWTEDDGTRVRLTDGYVAPPVRRRGLGRILLREAEIAAARLGEDALAVLAGNASQVQPDRAALLERYGYRRVFTMVEMEHDGSAVTPRPLPGGVVIRPARVADAQRLTALTARVWAGRPYFTTPAEEQIRGWLRRSDLSRFDVATAGERIVALVAVERNPLRIEFVDVEVDPDYQRRGLATAMLARALTVHRGAPVRLHTEGHDPAGARTLYERLGFRVIREHHRYRKPAGDGRPPDQPG